MIYHSVSGDISVKKRISLVFNCRILAKLGICISLGYNYLLSKEKRYVMSVAIEKKTYLLFSLFKLTHVTLNGRVFFFEHIEQWTNYAKVN